MLLKSAESILTERFIMHHLSESVVMNSFYSKVALAQYNIESDGISMAILIIGKMDSSRSQMNRISHYLSKCYRTNYIRTTSACVMFAAFNQSSQLKLATCVEI